MTDNSNSAADVPAAEAPAPTQSPAPATGERKGGVGLMAWFAIICWPLLVATAVYVYQGKKLADRTPDVLVVDDIALIKLAMNNGADRNSPDSIRAEVDRIVAANGMQNSILLSRSMILYAPPGSQVSVSLRPEPQPAAPAEPARTLK